MPEQRRTFGPVVLAGLAGATLLAVASAKPWFTAAIDYRLRPGVPEPETRADSPLALALALVVLAAWGALLVTRARARRVLAGVALVAALGVVGALVAAPFTLPNQLREQLKEPEVSVSPTGWFVAAAVAAVLSLPTLVAALRLAAGWPEMGTRYDAPGGADAPGSSDPRDLWKALDEGHDPTDRTTGD